MSIAPPNVHIYYFVEAVICSCISGIVLLLFILQILAESRNPQLLGAIHRTFHRFGLLGSILIFVWSWDSQGTLGLHSWKSVLALTDGYSDVAYFCLVKLVVTSASIISTMKQKSDFLFWLETNEQRICVISSVLLWTIDFVCDTISVHEDSTRLYGFFLVSEGLSLVFCVVLMNRVLYEAYTVSRFQKDVLSALKDTCCVSKNTRKLRWGVIGLSAVALILILFGVQDLINPRVLSQVQTTPDPRTPNFNVWWVAEMIAQLVILNSSWLPLTDVPDLPKSPQVTIESRYTGTPKASMS
eukprot:TRINITY_DN17325_c0_g1_i1.p1 TRINITY_DN17325_c0_g1~~TRINITY_DN17325_c0_g1_i1.p1  ORF type:complete len:299 (-),score=47.24 TRINITY_DN17325_c0_g1_i1:107-1003(-)